MQSLYNRVAGQSVERLAALSDGIFAVAMTLLVLDLRVPAAEAIGFLCAVCLVPFSTSLLAEFIHYRIALLVYWFNILLLGLTLLWSWNYASRTRLLAEDLSGEIHPAVVRRIVIAQSLYACGATLCFINTYWSIAAIVMVQVNYAIAPRFCWGLFSRKSEGRLRRVLHPCRVLCERVGS
jgi:uncharacterized membrane protein